MIAVALVITTPMAAKTVMVVGSAITCPTACSFWLRPKRVKSGMLSERVAQKPIMAVSEGTKIGQNSCQPANFPWCARIGPSPCACVSAHHTSTAVMISTNGRGPVLHLAQQVHAPVDHQDVQTPEQQE